MYVRYRRRRIGEGIVVVWVNAVVWQRRRLRPATEGKRRERTRAPATAAAVPLSPPHGPPTIGQGSEAFSRTRPRAAAAAGPVRWRYRRQVAGRGSTHTHKPPTHVEWQLTVAVGPSNQHKTYARTHTDTNDTHATLDAA